MKPWEIKRTRERLKRLSGQKGVRLFFELYRAAREIMRASLMNENPHLSPKQLKIKINKLAESVGRL